MSQNLPHILPSLPPQVEESFATHQVTKQFYHEVETRLEFRRYCEWYHATAAQNRQDFQKMRGEVNILRWFRRS